MESYTRILSLHLAKECLVYKIGFTYKNAAAVIDDAIIKIIKRIRMSNSIMKHNQVLKRNLYRFNRLNKFC